MGSERLKEEMVATAKVTVMTEWRIPKKLIE
jgi:hypothetical protein